MPILKVWYWISAWIEEWLGDLDPPHKARRTAYKKYKFDWGGSLDKYFSEKYDKSEICADMIQYILSICLLLGGLSCL